MEGVHGPWFRSKFKIRGIVEYGRGECKMKKI
jgi:hypothetical protein